MNKITIKQQIKDMETKLAEMKAELDKPKEFEWKYPYHAPFLDHIQIREGTGCSKKLIEHGRYRQTQANAERALERNRLANRLEALAEQLDPDWVADWSNRSQPKYTVYLSDGIHTTSLYYDTQHIGQVYMSRNVAIKICNMLNNKEIEL